MVSPPTASPKTRSRSASSKASTTKSASSRDEPTDCATKNISASRFSPACCRRYDPPKSPTRFPEDPNKKASYYQAQYLRLRSRRGPQKAICAVAASILTAIYNMLKNGTIYQDLGADHINRRSKITQTQRLVKRLEPLGYAVEIQPLAA